MQKDNVGNDFRSGICLERIVGQANCAEQISTFGNVLAGSAVPAVQRVPGSDKSHDATRTYLVDSFRKEIVVDGKSQLVVRFVIDLILTERHIADCQIIEIPTVGGFKACYRDVSLRVQLFGNAPGDAVQLHTIQAAVLHGIRQHSKEVSDTHARLQDIARLKPHPFHRIVNGMNDGRTGIVSVQDGTAGCFVFFLRKQAFQFRVLA